MTSVAVKQLILDLLARDKTGPATKSAAKNLDDVGDSAKESTRHLDKLDHEISNVEQELHGLARAWAEAGTAAERADLSKTIRSTQRELKELQKNKGILAKILPGDGETDQAGKGFAKKLAGSIGSGLTSISGTLGGSVGPTIGGAIGLAAGPVLISTLSSVISAGSGLGVLGVGIMAAVKGDATIQNAGKAAGASFVKGLQDSAGRSLRGPILDSLGVLSAAGDRLNKDLGGTFDALSGKLVPFTKKIVYAGEAVTGSLLKAARESGPAIDGLGDSIGLLGDGAAKFLGNLADGGPEAADNLRLVAGAMSDLLSVSGDGLKMFSAIADEPLLTGGLLPLLRDHYKEVADKQKDVAGSSEDLKGKQGALGDEMSATAGAAREQVDALTELSAQLKSETDPVFGLLRAQDQSTKAQKEMTKAAKEHGRNSPEYQEALRKSAEAALGLESAAGKVAATSSGKLGPAMRETLRLGGFTEAQIRDVEKQFRNAKKSGDAYAKTYKANVIANTAAAESNLKRARALLNDLRSKKITVSVFVAKTVQNKVANQLGDKAYRADGGPVKRGNAYVVGERRPEVFVPDRDGTIVPRLDHPALKAGGGGGAASPMVLEIRSGGSQLDDLLVEVLSRAVRRRGGNVQTVLGGRNA